MEFKQPYKSPKRRYDTFVSEAPVSDTFFENLIENQIADENWLTTKKAAAFLGITPNALRIRVHRGQVVAFRLGQHLRFSLTSLKMLLLKKEY